MQRVRLSLPTVLRYVAFPVSELTVSKEKEEPPLAGDFTKDHNQHEVEHHSLTHHPAEGRQEQVLE